MILHVFGVHSAQSAHRIKVCPHGAVVMRRLSILYFVLFCWVTCLLEMWKDGAPASQQKTRLNATMLAVNSLYISTPPQK